MKRHPKYSDDRYQTQEDRIEPHMPDAKRDKMFSEMGMPSFSSALGTILIRIS